GGLEKVGQRPAGGPAAARGGRPTNLLITLLLAGGLTGQTPSSLTLLPGDIVLRGPRAYQKLVVEAVYPDGHQQDVTASASLSVDRRIAAIEGDTLKPVADGATAVTATFSGTTASAKVRVRDFASGSPVPGFRNHVLPVMTKVGCNSGACH